MSKAKKGKPTGPCSAATKKKISNTLMGREFSEESKLKMRNSHLGKSIPEETRQKLRKPRSKEATEKMILTNTGRLALIKDNIRKMAQPNSEKWNALIEEGFAPLKEIEGYSFL